MNQEVAKVDDLAQLRNTNGDFGAGLMQAIQGFADDSKLALDGGLGSIVASVGLLAHVADESVDIRRRLFDIREQNAWIRLQR